MHKQHPQTAYRKYAVSLHDPSREKVNRENPQIFPIYKSQIIFPLQRRRPPPVAETGRSCWGSGQQDASAAQGTMRMLGAATRKTRRAFKSLYPPKGAQDHIRSISASTSSMRVAQLVAMRTTVWVSSNFSQKPNFALPSSAASWVFSSTRKIWLVGESIKKR